MERKYEWKRKNGKEKMEGRNSEFRMKPYEELTIADYNEINRSCTISN